MLSTFGGGPWGVTHRGGEGGVAKIGGTTLLCILDLPYHLNSHFSQVGCIIRYPGGRKMGFF